MGTAGISNSPYLNAGRLSDVYRFINLEPAKSSTGVPERPVCPSRGPQRRDPLREVRTVLWA